MKLNGLKEDRKICRESEGRSSDISGADIFPKISLRVLASIDTSPKIWNISNDVICDPFPSKAAVSPETFCRVRNMGARLNIMDAYATLLKELKCSLNKVCSMSGGRLIIK